MKKSVGFFWLLRGSLATVLVIQKKDPSFDFEAFDLCLSLSTHSETRSPDMHQLNLNVINQIYTPGVLRKMVQSINHVKPVT